MEFWVNLGIEQTTDTEAITNAYREKLKLVNPEDKPQEFMTLHAEYEAALKYAKEAEKSADTSALTPVELWIRKIDEIYREFSRRTDLNEWQDIFSDELCEGIDSRLDARDALLKFLMKQSLLPSDVWNLIIEKFSLKECRDELYNHFPKEFIDDVFAERSPENELIKFSLFDEDTTGNPDPYFHLCFKLRNEIRSGEFEAAAATLEDIEKTGFNHPYTEHLRCRYLWNGQEKGEEALAVASSLYEKYPEDADFCQLYADMLFNNKRYDEAKSVYEKLLEINENNAGAAFGKAQCLQMLGEYENAKKIYFNLLDRFPNDGMIFENLSEINNKLKEQYSSADISSEDFETQINFAWSCLQTDENEKAYELASSLRPTSLAECCDKENILTKICLNSEKPEKALIHAKEWLEGVKELPEGETETEIKRKKKTGEILYLTGSALLRLKRYDEALEKAEEIIALEAPGNDDLADAYTLRRSVFYAIGRFDDAVEAAEKIVELNKNAASYIGLGIALFDDGRMQDSFNAFGTALDFSRDYISFFYRGRILAEYDEWDEVRKLLEFLRANGVDTEAMKYLDARILEGEEKKDEALEAYNALIAKYEAPDCTGETQYDLKGIIHEIYSRAAELQEGTKEPAELVEMLDKGLAVREHYYPLLSFKAFLLDNRLEKHQEGMDVYKKILGIYPKNTYAIAQIGHIYFDNFYDFKSALEYYFRFLELKQDSHINSCAGRCLTFARQYDKAEEFFKKALELEDNQRAKMNLAMLYEYQYRFEDSYKLLKEVYEKNLEAGSEGNKFVYKNFARVLSRLGRRDEAINVLLKRSELFKKDVNATEVMCVCMEAGRYDDVKKYSDMYKADDAIDDFQYSNLIADNYRLRGDYKGFAKAAERITDAEEKYSRLAWYYMTVEKYDKAYECYKKLIALGDDTIYNYTSYIELLWQTGNKDEARRIAKIYLEKNERRKNQSWHLALYETKEAFILLYSGEYTKAKKIIDKLLESSPLCEHCRYGKCKDAIYLLGRYYEYVGEFDKAIETYREGQKVAVDEYDFAVAIARIQKKYKRLLKKENRK